MKIFKVLMNTQKIEADRARYELTDLSVTSKLGVAPTAGARERVDGSEIDAMAEETDQSMPYTRR